MKKKLIAITMGEPSGIASELVIKTWKLRKKFNLPHFFLIDDFKKIQYINNLFKLNINLKKIHSPEDAYITFDKALPIIDLKINLNFTLGVPDKKNIKYIKSSIDHAFRFVKKKIANAMITMPICKKTFKESGFRFNGQTEYISHLFNKEEKKKHVEIMILSTIRPVDNGPNLRVGLITTHIPFSRIIDKLNKNIIIQKICSFNDSLKKIWKIANPTIGICSINPHAGEGGLLGNEEIKLIEPIKKKLDKKIKVIGPLSSDSCFFKENRKKYDGIICFYHDQGLTPIKILDFYNSINITGGLPIMRVSPDHGPAFDIATQNIAKTNSLISSLNFVKSIA